jgi:hypothetical protein
VAGNPGNEDERGKPSLALHRERERDTYIIILRYHKICLSTYTKIRVSTIRLLIERIEGREVLIPSLLSIGTSRDAIL